MATKSLTLKYGVVAVILALAVIGTSLHVNPMTANAQTNFAVMLTDPPNVPDGTTKLEVTYSNIQLHVIYQDGTSGWVPAQDSGTVDLLTLVDVSQTIANVKLPTKSAVDKLQFTISSAEATIDGEVQSVNILSDLLVVNIKRTVLNGTGAGAMIDLRPSLLRIRAVDPDGNPISYYVLVPSATAVIQTDVTEDYSKVGGRHGLSSDDHKRLDDEFNRASKDIIITDATLTIDGTTTSLSVTLKNTGTKDVVIHGITVQGDFDYSKPVTPSAQGNEGKQGGQDDNHPRDIPFQISGENLIPRMGDNINHDGINKGLEIKQGETKTLKFTGVIQLKPNEHSKASPITITPIKGNKYTIRVEGEGSETFDVTVP